MVLYIKIKLSSVSNWSNGLLQLAVWQDNVISIMLHKSINVDFS